MKKKNLKGRYKEEEFEAKIRKKLEEKFEV
jgi:hypothetical protein